MDNPKDKALFVLAEGFYEKKRFREAAALLNDLQQRYPDDERVGSLRKQCQESIQRGEQSEEGFDSLFNAWRVHKVVTAAGDQDREQQRKGDAKSKAAPSVVTQLDFTEDVPAVMGGAYKPVKERKIKFGWPFKVAVAFYVAITVYAYWEYFVPLPGTTRVFSGMEFVWIPPGSFYIESTDDSKEKSRSKVKVSSGFWMGKYEITEHQWNTIIESNRTQFKDEEVHLGVYEDAMPIRDVSWEECQAFIRGLQLQGVGLFRLPTEAEWELACRARSKKAYAYGDEMAGLDEYAWYENNAKGSPKPVGLKRANRWNLHDMHGNVAEWCSDWGGNYPNTRTLVDPKGPSSGSARVVRGGDWSLPAKGLTSSRRDALNPSSSSPSVGFRLCKDKGKEDPLVRRIMFPTGRSMGTLWVNGRQIGAASGEVRVLQGEKVRLEISEEGAKDLSPLSTLLPDSFFAVEISYIRIPDNQMIHLSSLTGLIEMNLQGSILPPQGLAELEPLKHLERLILTETAIIGEELTYLSQLKNLTGLKDLSLNRLPLQNDDIAHLKELNELRRLDLVSSGIDEETLKGLQFNLPMCRISPRPPQPTIEECLQLARAEGRYSMLLKQFKGKEEDLDRFGRYAQEGFKSRSNWRGERSEHFLPPGYWVYVYPYWYIWEHDLSRNAPPQTDRSAQLATGSPDNPKHLSVSLHMVSNPKTAWAFTMNPDSNEWLMAEYEEVTRPESIRIFGLREEDSVSQVNLFTLEGDEIESWRRDEDHATRKADHLELKLRASHVTNRVRIIFQSPSTKTYQEVDAVGLFDLDDRLIWATGATASTIYEVPYQWAGTTQPFRGLPGLAMNLAHLIDETLENNDYIRKLLGRVRRTGPESPS